MQRIPSIRKKLTLLIAFMKIKGIYKSDDTKISFKKGSAFTETGSNLKRWRAGIHAPNQQSLANISRDLIQEHQIKDENNKLISYDFFDDNIPSMDIGIKLGLTRRYRQYFISQLYSTQLPRISPFLLSHTDAKNCLKKNGGLFKLYRIDENVQGYEKALVSAPIAVRFLMEKKKFGFGVRSKMVIPNTENRNGLDFEYDGFIAPTEKTWYWHFEIRNPKKVGIDIVSIATDSPAIAGDKRYFLGQMVSTDQVTGRPKNWSCVIVQDNDFKLEPQPVPNLNGLYSLSYKGSPCNDDHEKDFIRNNCKFDDLASCDDAWLIRKLLS